MPKRKDLTGQVFSHLKVIQLDENKTKEKKRTYWTVECDCGVQFSVLGSNLSSGNTTKCKYCKAEIEDFRSLSSYLEKNNIQILSLPIDAPVLGDKNNLTSEFRSQVEKITNGVSIKYTIFRDTIISNRFLGNAISIPTLVIFDNEGNMIKKIDFDINSDDFIRIFDAIIGEE